MNMLTQGISAFSRQPLPIPRAGLYTIARPRRVPVCPLVFSTVIADGARIRRIVFGLSIRSTRLRAVRIVRRQGHEVRQAQR